MDVSTLSKDSNSASIVDIIRILNILGRSKEKGFAIIPSILAFITAITLKYINPIRSETIIPDDL